MIMCNKIITKMLRRELERARIIFGREWVVNGGVGRLFSALWRENRDVDKGGGNSVKDGMGGDVWVGALGQMEQALGKLVNIWE